MTQLSAACEWRRAGIVTLILEVSSCWVFGESGKVPGKERGEKKKKNLQVSKAPGVPRTFSMAVGSGITHKPQGVDFDRCLLQQGAALALFHTNVFYIPIN